MKQFLALKASAGSGKTFALTVRYISLLLLEVNPTSILTLTFTNKAALEMSGRIYSTLLSLGDDKNIIEAITIQTSLSESEILSKKQNILKVFIQSELSIYTLDKFINKILREFSGYIDISDDFTIDTDDEDLMLYNFLISLDSIQFDLLINFSYKHEKKLSTITQLFKVIDEKNEELTIEEFDILVLNNFETNILTSAQKIKTHILNSSASVSAKKAVDFNSITELLEKGKTWLVNDSLNDYKVFVKANCSIELDDEFNNIKFNLSLYFKYRQKDILNKLFTIFNNFKEFRLKYKRVKNSFEFRDITNLVYILLNKVIEKDFLYFRLDIKYDHMLIDEFQDTSVLQYKILEPLIEELLSGYSEKFRTFFYVGDIKQSIYRFRGGTKELFDFVIDKYDDVLELEVLDMNYRSSKNVVNYVNTTFLNIPNYEYYAQKVNSKDEGCVELTPLDLEKDDKYEDIKNKLQELFKAGVRPNNIAILTYTNKDVLALYEYLINQFKDLKILTELTSKLINQINVKAVINLIKYVYFNESIYKSNFNSLLGVNLEENIELKLNLKTNDVVTLVKIIATKYNLIDDNMIKFIDIVSRYTDIVDFIYEIDNNDATMINKEKEGLQILTVFKSKGLEFDTVFVLDRITKKNADRSTLLFEYDNIELNNIYYKSKYRENFDSEYKMAKDKEKELSLGDELNILYVALTRAKNNLFIFKKAKSSVFDNLGLNLEYFKLGEILVQKEIFLNNNTLEKLEYKALNLGKQKVSKKDTIESIENIKARYFGIATHYCLEMMKEFTCESLEVSINLVTTKYSNYLTENDIEDIKTRVLLLIANTNFQEFLKDSTYYKEQELIYNNELKIIDLLIQKENKVIIIDYKTTKTHQESHLNQVEYYKSAISSITSDLNIECFVVYLHKENIDIVSV